MSYAPGELPTKALTLVEPGTYLAIKPARAYKRAKAAFKARGKVLSIVKGAGGYRSKATQNAMADAGAGSDQAAKRRWNLNPFSKVAIARHPYGTHERGESMDLLVNGRFPDAGDRDLLRQFGMTRPFDERDPNHYRQDGKTATAPFAPSSTKPKAVPKSIKVAHGDTLGKIADAANTTVHAILALNPSITNPNAISVGQSIRIR